MSGHSKWSTIKHQKEATDQKRGKMFSKLARAISVAVKEGNSGDPQINSKLRLAIEQARAINMPKNNIKRAIEKGLGKGGAGQLQTIIYEGFGPEKTAVVVECVSDNKNRAGAEIKSFFERAGGGLGAPGSASYLFEKKGLILVEKKDNIEEQILSLIDLGVEDVEEDGLYIFVYTKPNAVESARQEIEKKGFIVKELSLCFKAKSPIVVSDKEKQTTLKGFLKRLEGLDGVQKVYINVEFSALKND